MTEIVIDIDAYEIVIDTGVQGIPGVGVPAGGTTGQVLKKQSNDDYDTDWEDESGSGGSSTFIGLSDTPGTYAAQALKVVRVTNAEDGLEFTLLSTVAATGDYGDLINVPSTFTPSAHVHSTSDITSGTFADARISESSVTQYQSALAIDWSQLLSIPSTFTPSAHVHTASDVTSGTFADARISESSVTQHQSALTITESQISDLAHVTDLNDIGLASTSGNFVYAVLGNWVSISFTGVLSGQSVGILSDVTLTSAASGDFLRHNGTAFVDSPIQLGDITSGMVTQHEGDLTITESQISDLGNYALVGHTHTASEITDFSTAADARIAAASVGDLSDVTITANTSGEILVWNGSAWINQTLAEAGISAVGHTHAASDVTSGTFDDARIASSNVTQHQALLSIATTQLTGNMPDARIVASNVTQHQAALTIAHTQLTGFNFLNLSDTPSSYSGQANKTVRVNASGTGLEFVLVSTPTTPTFLTLTDSPSSYSGQALKVVRVNAGATGVEFGVVLASIASSGSASDLSTGSIPNARVPSSAVTQHQASLSIATSQLTGNMPDARIVASNVTQHQASLSIGYSQLTGTPPVSLEPQGVWVTSTAYTVNDVVFNDGYAYICKLGHTSGASTEPGVGASWTTNWDLIDPARDPATSGAEVPIGYYEGSVRYRFTRSHTVASTVTTLNLGALPRTPSKMLVFGGSINVGAQKVQIPYVGYAAGDSFCYNMFLASSFVFLQGQSLTGGTAPNIASGWVIEQHLEYI